MKIRYQ